METERLLPYSQVPELLKQHITNLRKERRLIKQRITAMEPKCRCGNSLGATNTSGMCPTCEDKVHVFHEKQEQEFDLSFARELRLYYQKHQTLEGFST